MAEKTKIQWTTHTQNFWRGCAKVHTGCLNCYAESHFSCRLHGVDWGTARQGGNRKVAWVATWRNPFAWNTKANKSGQRDRVFCMSLGDFFESWKGPMVDAAGHRLFYDAECSSSASKRRKDAYLTEHHAVERHGDLRQAQLDGIRPATMDDVRRDAMLTIEQRRSLDWLLLTKHGLWNDADQIIQHWAHDCCKCGHRQWRTDDSRCTKCRGKIRPAKVDHVWLLGSVSDQPTADRIVRQLHKIKTAGLCRFVGLSAEPLVGPLRLREGWDWLDWLIIGGESTQGGRCRRMDLQWTQKLLGDCRRLRIPAFVKQLGSDCGKTLKSGTWRPHETADDKGGEPAEWPAWAQVRRYPTGERQL